MVTNKAIYEKLTHRLIEKMKKGVLPWVKPWRTEGGGTFGAMPLNAATRRPYSGLNVLLLWMEAEERGFKSLGWCTARQAFKAGAIVKKGERGTHIMFMSRIVRKAKTKAEDDKVVWLVRTYTVFNLDQLGEREKFPGTLAWLRDRAGDPDPTKPKAKKKEEPDITPILFLEDMVAETKAKIAHRGNVACYSKSADQITMPPTNRFKTAESYYAVLFHELTHWTGHETRLNRLEALAWMGDPKYAMEELVAELGAAFLCGRHRIDTVTQSASYLKHWLERLNDDPTAIVKAASAATRAVELITGERPEDFVPDDDAPAPERRPAAKPRRTRRTTRSTGSKK